MEMEATCYPSDAPLPSAASVHQPPHRVIPTPLSDPNMEGAWGDALDIPLTRRVVVLGALLIWSECGANLAELHSRDFHRRGANFTDVFQNEWETSWTGAPKCCETGYGLEGTREGVNALRCVGIEANENISNVNNFQNLRHDISTQCPSFRLEVLNKVSFDELFFNCVDQLVSGGGLSNELVGLKCEIFNNSDDLSEQDSEAMLNKCCPEHFRYDPYFRDCYQVDDFPSEALLNGVAHAHLSVDKIKHEVITCEGQMIVDDFVPENNVYIFNNGVLLVNSSEQLILNQSTYCIDRTTLQSNHLVLRYCQDIEKTCRERRCFHKCCPDGESMYFQNCTPSQSFKTTNIVSSYDVETYMTLPTRRNSSVIRGYGVVHTLVCNTGMYNTNPNTEPNDWFKLDEFGDLIIPYYSSKVSITNYCLEHIYDNESDAILPVYCFPDEKSLREESPWKFILISVGLIMSSIFLMVTFLVYTFLPSLQNLHGKTLMCHVASLFCAYICLIVAQDATPWIEDTKWCPNIDSKADFPIISSPVALREGRLRQQLRNRNG
uniref:(California timema) hypothetical protein n=1 Tax=Timema californicum TaxID=61474 RepID=A0A7R9J4S6_TIMCA|nr:unnamed protein product [Timema californicum]